MRDCLAVALLFVVVPCLSLHAAVVWEKRSITIEATLSDDAAAAAFAFSNRNRQPVTITRVTPSCGCTVARLEKRTFSPGERGELQVVFTFEGRKGRQEKIITVETDEPGRPTYVLTLEVDIPSLFEVERRVLVWRRGDAVAPKAVRIRSLHPEVARPVGAVSLERTFVARLEASATSPNLYEVIIAPASTAAATQVKITVTTDSREKGPGSITLYALVR